MYTYNALKYVQMLARICLLIYCIFACIPRRAILRGVNTHVEHAKWFTCVCMYVHMYVRMHIRMYVHTNTYVCTYAIALFVDKSIIRHLRLSSYLRSVPGVPFALFFRNSAGYNDGTCVL